MNMYICTCICIVFLVNCLDFTSTELCDATNDFDKRNELGKGGFGNVFRAYNLRCNGTDAAVKVLTRVSIRVSF